ncbi:hypothetical protein F9B74_09795 [Pelistega sp. NLN82]|uniref:Uncharacterized protein n=1 Tax=Pelistega ratti TaxID=2652177 RepID=A0A6L9Y890_9BURK|nr:hypothetical protein [Pelistega ratti]NEN76596.1 hypothetical protein [Pelistega ratti]
MKSSYGKCLLIYIFTPFIFGSILGVLIFWDMLYKDRDIINYILGIVYFGIAGLIFMLLPAIFLGSISWLLSRKLGFRVVTF